MDPSFIVLFIVASLGSAALFGFILRHGAKRREAQRKLAEAKGWSYSHSAASGGKGSRTVISDPKVGWTLTLYSKSSSSGSGSGSSTVRWSMFEEPALALPDGVAVLGPDIPEEAAAMADTVLGMMGGDIGRMLLDRITGGLGDDAQDLRSVDSVGPGHLMATPGAETALDDLRFAPELNTARAGRNEAQQPIVMRGSFGLRLRVRHLLRTPEEIEDFVALGLALCDNLQSR